MILTKHAKNFITLKLWRIFALLLSLYFPFSAAAQAVHATPQKQVPKPWKLWRSSDDIKISYRPSHYKNIVEIKAQATLTSSLGGFIYFIEDLKHMPNWLDNAKSADIIEQISATENIFITRFSGIWPVSAREMIVYSTYWQNDDLSVEIAVEDASEVIPANKKHVRMQVLDAHWKIVPMQRGKIAITYQFIVDPKGKVPRWLAKTMTRSSILKTLKNLQQQLPGSKWQQHRKAHIQELQ
ncbi:MAG: START domain-containing protein [Cognaticolwellia sp.]